MSHILPFYNLSEDLDSGRGREKAYYQLLLVWLGQEKGGQLWLLMRRDPRHWCPGPDGPVTCCLRWG